MYCNLGHVRHAGHMRKTNQRVWFLVPPDTGGILNLTGPWEVLGHANELLGRTGYVAEAFSPAAPIVRTRHGLVLAELRPLPARFARAPDIVVIAGGSPLSPLPEAHAAIAEWVRRHHARFPLVVSICTGAFLLGEAGLLDGKRATTHWQYVRQLQARFPKAKVVDEGIHVRDGKVWTSAGLSAGIDLALALVEADHGHAVAMAVAKRMVLFLRRSGNQSQFSEPLRRQEKEPPRLRDLSTFVIDHLDHDLSVERLAAGVGMSPRSLSRYCREHLRESPAELVRRLRLEEARRLLAETDLPGKDIAGRTGLGDTSTLWRVFTQQLGITPAEYRQRFAAPDFNACT